MWKAGQITADTLAWRDGLADWIPVQQMFSAETQADVRTRKSLTGFAFKNVKYIVIGTVGAVLLFVGALSILYQVKKHHEKAELEADYKLLYDAFNFIGALSKSPILEMQHKQDREETILEFRRGKAKLDSVIKTDQGRQVRELLNELQNNNIRLMEIVDEFKESIRGMSSDEVLKAGRQLLARQESFFEQDKLAKEEVQKRLEQIRVKLEK